VANLAAHDHRMDDQHDDRVQGMQDTQIFLKLAAAELRRIIGRAPQVAVEPQHIARQLESEAEDLAAISNQLAEG
jgi:hypothetical protein